MEPNPPQIETSAMNQQLEGYNENPGNLISRFNQEQRRQFYSTKAE